MRRRHAADMRGGLSTSTAMVMAFLVSGCAASPDGAEGAPLVGERSWNLNPSQFAEANLAMNATHTVRAEFTASRELQWNIHSHNSSTNQQVIHQNGTSQFGSIEFTAPENGIFSIMWTNRGLAAATLNVEIRGEATGVSFYPG